MELTKLASCYDTHSLFGFDNYISSLVCGVVSSEAVNID